MEQGYRLNRRRILAMASNMGIKMDLIVLVEG